MNIFYKRPLCLILFTAIGSFVVFSRTDDVYRLLLLLGSLLVILFAILSHIGNRQRIILLLCSSVMILSMLISTIYFDLWFYANRRFFGEVSITGEVWSIESGDWYSNVIVKTDDINGKPLSSYKILLNINKYGEHNIDVGDTISFTGEISRVTSDMRISDGINGIVEKPGNLTLVHRSEKPPLRASLALTREKLTRYAIALTDKDSGALLSALLTGNKSYLSAVIKNDFRRIGISHILALSGMHLAILTLCITKFLRFFRLGKRTRFSIAAIFAIGYIIFTGFPITVIRAGIMLLLTSTLTLFRKTHDSITSLAITVALILVATPYAIFDVSLWLSALATLGVIISAQYLSSLKPCTTIHGKILRSIIASLLCSVFAISTTIMITVTEFGTISPVAPFATLLFSVLIELIMYLGTLTLLLGKITPMGALVRILSQQTLKLAAKISDIDGVLVSARDMRIYVAALVLTIAVFMFFIIKIRHKTAGVVAVTLLLAATFGLSYGIHRSHSSTTAINYSADERSDIFFLRSYYTSAIINSSTYSKNTGYAAANIALYEGATNLDFCIYTRYYSGLIDDFTALSSYIMVDTIYLPTPKTNEETAMLREIIIGLSDFRTKILCYLSDSKITVGAMQILPLFRSTHEESPTEALAINYGETKILYYSSGILQSPWKYEARDMIPEASVIVFGAHGQKYNDEIHLKQRYARLKSIVFSSKNLYIDVEEVMWYKENGCNIYLHPSNVSLLK